MRNLDLLAQVFFSVILLVCFVYLIVLKLQS